MGLIPHTYMQHDTYYTVWKNEPGLDCELWGTGRTAQVISAALLFFFFFFFCVCGQTHLVGAHVTVVLKCVPAENVGVRWPASQVFTWSLFVTIYVGGVWIMSMRLLENWSHCFKNSRVICFRKAGSLVWFLSLQPIWHKHLKKILELLLVIVIKKVLCQKFSAAWEFCAV